MMRVLRLWAFVAVGAVSLVGSAAAAASTYTASTPVLVSGLSPFASCTVGARDSSSVVYPNAEVEPFVAVDPTNTSRVVGVFQQDRWSDGGAHGLVAARSSTGGASWTESWAPLSTCAGGTSVHGGAYDRSSDPWVSFAPNGDVYQVSISVSADEVTSAVLVSKSTDHGATWSNPVTLNRDVTPFSFNDKESVTADPTSSSRVYAVWDRSRKPGDNASTNALHSFAFRGDVYFSRTTDGGSSWEQARDILNGNRNEFTIGNQIAVLPTDGTLVDVFDLSIGSGVQPADNKFREAVIRSTDHGVTWSDPITISTEGSLEVTDPDSGAPVRAGTNIPDIAVSSAGTLYVVWATGMFSGGAHDDIAISKSTDGGLTWSMPLKVNQTPTNISAADQQAFTPAVDVASDGTVGVSYYDFRNNTAAAGALTDMFLAHSHDGGQTWAETRVTPTSFDIEAAPIAEGYFLGDYSGLTHTGATFDAFYSKANTGNSTNPTDIYWSTIGP